ncbi:MAG: antitoxin [Deltaproteobacteria bacterium RIFCSPHIGHO2_12_FULL_43_9]|nr:MAG: antitoxin [Deltaproteobacteria bacterium RIFCSPHIGHO2_12_FULL_43_9]
MVKGERIEINPDIMLGKPVIKGTRITVELILRKLAEGATVQDVILAYPTINASDVKAALLFSG